MPACGVCPSVCLSRSWVVPKWIKISSNFFHHRVAKPFKFFIPNGVAPTGTPLTGASNARGYEKNDDFRQISRCILETVIVRWAHAARNKNVVKIAIFGLKHWLKHRITRKLLKIVHAARGLASIELSFHPCNILRDNRRGIFRGNKNVGCGTWKRRFFALAVRITGKLLKIDG